MVLDIFRYPFHYSFIVKCFSLLQLAFIFFYSPAVTAYDIAVVQSMRIAPYDEAFKGFQSVCNHKVERLVISDLAGPELLKKIDKIRPDLVLAIGMDALLQVRSIDDIPVVYIMVLNPLSILSGQKNIRGVSMNIPQEKQLLTFAMVLPDIKRIGLLYDPEKTGNHVKKALDAAGKTGITIIAKETRRLKDVPPFIVGMKRKIDAFWMLPDMTVISPETIEFMLLFSFENRIPILTFSKKYVELGALISIDIDTFDIGRQAGEMVEKILAGRGASNIQNVNARKTDITINLKIARKLGIQVNGKTLKGFRIID
ncbi:MAG: ABC transporter substrate-binding protein [Thermodesulfobacteriota bacterium]|nr:ABC transporter substrate-binding protein [Thermodesulfobacteriota bacterium]